MLRFHAMAKRYLSLVVTPFASLFIVENHEFNRINFAW